VDKSKTSSVGFSPIIGGLKSGTLLLIVFHDLKVVAICCTVGTRLRRVLPEGCNLHMHAHIATSFSSWTKGKTSSLGFSPIIGD
jgi:hypothetical protein